MRTRAASLFVFRRLVLALPHGPSGWTVSDHATGETYHVGIAAI
jgi:hypothetical protein